MPQETQNLIWIDLEMTGLDPERDRIIEIATVVTNKFLDILAEGPVIAIFQKDEILTNMDDWNTKQHMKSGLTDRVRVSRTDAAAAEAQTLTFLKRYTSAGLSPMCGNSVCQDRRFLARRMPSLETFFHYRNLDVSTLKELAQWWTPDIAKGFKKESSHLALDDIYDSIEELKYYREKLLKL